MKCRALAILVALCLAVPVVAPAIAPASGGDAPTATAAKKKCKKGYKRVKGKCKKKKKKSSGNTYKGTPPEITVSVSGATVTFKWSLSKCSATGCQHRSLSRLRSTRATRRDHSSGSTSRWEQTT